MFSCVIVRNVEQVCCARVHIVLYECTECARERMEDEKNKNSTASAPAPTTTTESALHEYDKAANGNHQQ